MALEKSLVLFPLLILVFLGLGWVQAHLGKESPPRKSQREHMDSLRNPNYCTYMMQRRNMTRGHCKAMNTFVHEPLADVQAVCFQRNVPCRNITLTNCYESNSNMQITFCRLKGSSVYPNCSYQGRQMNRKIVVACQGSPYVPVHLDGYV